MIAAHAINIFGIEHGNLWFKASKESLFLLKEGLEKANFDNNNKDFSALKEVLELTKELSEEKFRDPSRYLKDIKKLDEKIKKLVNEYDFQDKDFNNFLYQASLCFTQLVQGVYTDKTPFAEVFMNPNNEPNPYQSPVVDYFIQKGAKRVAKHFLREYSNQVLPTFKMQCSVLENITLTKSPIKIKNTKIKGELEKRLGNYNNILKSQTVMTDAKSIASYMSEQICLHAYEFYFNQIVKMYETLEQVDTFSKDEGEKDKWLSENGLMELRKAESINYMNKLAQVLSFKDAKDLYHTYKDHKDKELANVLLDKVNLFRKQVADPNLTEEKKSPLTRLHDLSSAEYSRLSPKLADKNFVVKNNEYISQVYFASKELKDELSSLFLIKGVLNETNDNYLDLENYLGREEDRNLFYRLLGDVSQRLINSEMFKNKTDEQIFERITKKEQMLARRQEKAWQPLEKKWLEFVTENSTANNKMLADLINNIKDRKYSYEALLDLMIQFEVDYIDANKKLKTLKVGDPDYTRQIKIKQISEAIFKNKENIFSLFKMSNIEEKTKDMKYDSSMEEMAELHKKLILKRKGAAAELSDLHASERELLEALENEKGNWFVSGVKRLFGYKNKREKELTQTLNHQLGKINVIKRNIKEIEIKQKQVSLNIVSLEKEQEENVNLKGKSIPDLKIELSKHIRQYQAFLSEREDLVRNKGTAEKFLENENHLLSCGYYIQRILPHIEDGFKSQPANPENVFEAIRFLDKIKSLKELLSKSTSNVAINRQKILEEVKKLEGNLNLIVEYNQKQLQDDAVLHLENEISFDEANISVILDKMVRSVHYKKLDNAHKEEIHGFVDKKIVEYISKNKQSMSLSTLRDFFVQTKSFSLVHQINENPEFVSNQYRTSLQTVLNAIDEKYKTMKLLEGKDIVEKIPFIQNELMIGIDQLKKSVNDEEYYARQNESSWDPRWLLAWWNGKDAGKKKLAEVEAYQLICEKEINHFISIMEKHKDDMLHMYKDGPLYECENEINKREIFSQYLYSLKTNPQIYEHLDINRLIEQNHEMMRSLRDIKSTHPEQHLHAINSEIDILSEQINKIQEEIEIFNSKKKSRDVNVENISNIGSLLNESVILKRSLIDTLAVKGLTSNKFFINPNKKLSELREKLETAQKQFSQEIIPFSAVIKKEPLNVASISDDMLGTLLILSLEHGNSDAFEKIINEKDRVDVQSIVQAYLVAASLGDIDKVNKLSSMRDDFSIPAYDLNQALQKAVSNNHLKMAYYILLNNKIALNNRSDELLEKISSMESSDVPKAKKTWLETIFRGESQNNRSYRACFILAEQLIKQANSIYESSEKTERDKIVFKDMVEYALNMTGGLVRKISLRTGDEGGQAYISECNQYIQSIINELDISLISVYRGNVDDQKIKEAETNLINAVNKWDSKEVVLKLSILKNLTFHDKNKFYKIISKALDEVKEDDYLNILLSEVDDSAKRKELAGNALLTSIRTGKVDQLSILVNHHGFEKNEEAIQKTIIQLYDEKNEQRIAQLNSAHLHIDDMTRLLMMNVPFNVDDTFITLVNYSTNTIPDSGKYSVTQGLMQRFSDNDKVILENLKKIYVLQEKQLQMLEDNFDREVLDFYNNCLNEVNEPADLDPSIVFKLKKLIQSYENQLAVHSEDVKPENQTNGKFYEMKEVRDNFSKHKSFNVENQKRKMEHLNKWDLSFNDTFNNTKGQILREINRIKSELQFESSNKRQNLLFSASSVNVATESSSSEKPVTMDFNAKSKKHMRQ